MTPCCRSPDVVVLDEIRCCQSCGEVLEDIDGVAGAIASMRLEDTITCATSPKTKPYTFVPLGEDEIRLIEIQPGKFEDPLVCQIFHGTAEGNAYEALSYTWADESGDQQRQRQIIVCSSIALGVRTVQATTNCEMALRRLRRLTETRIIWVDALCIDQDNVVERGHQVRQMQTIYANATIVHAYIGELDAGTEEVFNRIDGSVSTLSQSSVQMFLQRRWFSRIWCLQEIAMATGVDLICGSRTIPWGSLPVACLLRLVPQHQPFPLIMRLQLNGKQRLDRLQTLLEAARRSCKATDSRDMVYAILGIMEELNDERLQIDYHLQSADIFNRVTEFLLDHCGIGLLGQSGTTDQRWEIDHDRQRFPGFASWAIDFTICQYTSLANLRGTVSMSRTCVDRLPFSSVEDKERRVLSLQGRKAGTVLAHTLNGSTQPPIAKRSVDGPQRVLGGVGSNVHLLEAGDRRRLKWESKIGKQYEHLLFTLFGDQPGCYGRGGRARNGPWDPYSDEPRTLSLFDLLAVHRPWLQGEKYSEYLQDRTIFLLDTMCIGIGPPWLGPDDVLVKFENAADTFFIRQKGDHYMLVGECIIIPHDPLAQCYQH